MTLTRNTVLGLLLALTVGGIGIDAWLSRDGGDGGDGGDDGAADGAVVSPAATARKAAGMGRAMRRAAGPGGDDARRIHFERLAARDRQAGDSEVVDLFAARSWKPPPPPAPPPPPPPRPVAPPFPYAYMGGMVEGGARTAYFSNDSRVLAVKSGDLVDGAYRVDAIDAGQIALTYVPLHQTLIVSTGGPR